MLELAYQTVIRAGLGLVAMIPGILIYLLIVQTKGHKISPLHKLGIFIFSYYLMGVLTVTGIGSIKEFCPRLVVIPFVDFLPSMMQSILNIVLFMPLGFLLPLIFGKSEHLRKIVLIGFLFSLSIELIQMFGFGATDVNDLMTNTLGTICGFGLWKVISSKLKHNSVRELIHNSRLELLLLFIYAWFVMLTVQPWIVSLVGDVLSLG